MLLKHILWRRGQLKLLKKKRMKILRVLEVAASITGASGEEEACTRSEDQKRLIQQLEHQNHKLAKKLRNAKEKCEMVTMVGRMEDIIASASNQQQSPVCTATKVDIGLGVCFNAGVLHRIERGAKGDGTKLARSVMRAVFLPEEMVRRTLYGKPCNAHKGASPKPALDETRREAVLAYACARRPRLAFETLKGPKRT
ncbi:uncharacterized protein LOC135387158 isoform X2 [Ornithodoros turicata]|uniref:uncharacterized protein LOC135387158 isoform X2 n=1 Tax=Ornithodoros turicata TaxID=34597 RepID=UPI00313A2F43